MSWLRRRVSVPAWVLAALVIGTIVTASSLFVATYIIGQPDFALTASPNSVTVLTNGAPPPRNGLDWWTVLDVRPVNNFTGIVSLSVTAPTNVTTGLQTFNFQPLNQVSLGFEQQLNLTIATKSSGNFSVVVTGTSGKLSHSITVKVTSSGLQFTAYPNPLNVTRGSFATVTVTFASQNGLSGNFSLSVSPCGPYGTNWCVPSGAPATILVGVNAPATFQVTISTTTAFNGGVEYFGVGTPLGSTRFYLPVNAA